MSCLPFSDAMFDLVTAVNTHNYWPELVADMQEVLRVLKPSGKLMIMEEDTEAGNMLTVMKGLQNWSIWHS